jgi:hypothetical protein
MHGVAPVISWDSDEGYQQIKGIVTPLLDLLEQGVLAGCPKAVVV